MTMIMKKYILLLTAFCLGLLSCQKEDMSGINDGLTTFKATCPGATKTVLEGLTPMWTPSDSILIFDGEINLFKNSLTAPSATAEFRGVLAGQGRQHYLAVCPADTSITFYMLGKTIYGLEVPAEQTAVEGSYDPNALVSMAYTTDHTLNFKNLGSLIKFTVKDEGVKSVTVQAGEEVALAGQFFAAYDEPIRINVKEGVSSVTLKGDFKKGSTYYIVTLPAVIANGFTVTLNNEFKAKDFKNPVALERSGLVDIGSLSFTPEEEPETPDQPGTDNPGAADGTTVYLKPNSNWLEANARFAAYFFEDGKPEVWVNLVQDSANGVFKCDTPDGYTNIIFVRMNPASADNNWDNKWGQTADLKVPTNDNVCYVIAPDTWGEDGYWTSYPPAETPDQPGTDNPGTDNPGTGTNGQVIYLTAGPWDVDGAWFEVWSWPTGGEGKWYQMETVSTGLYKCTIPTSNSNVIFVRRGPDMVSGWDQGVHYWNKTDDLAIPAGKNHYTITGWGGSEGSWSTR